MFLGLSSPHNIHYNMDNMNAIINTCIFLATHACNYILQSYPISTIGPNARDMRFDVGSSGGPNIVLVTTAFFRILDQ
jgi:hypothetical protein